MASTYFHQGRYWGRVVDWNLGTSRNKGTPQFSVTFEVTDELDSMGERAGLVGSPQQRTVYLYLTEKSMSIALEALKVLGYNRTSLKHLDRSSQQAHDFSGIECELYCKIEEYEGEDRERWSINTPREPVKPVDPNDLRKLDALFGKHLKAQAGNGSAPQQQQTEGAPVGAAPASDDIPF